MKRLASLLVVLLLALGLVGCGGKEKKQENGVVILPKPAQQELSIESIDKLHDGLAGDISPDGNTLLFTWDQGMADTNPHDEMAPLRSLHQLNFADGLVEKISDSDRHQGNARYSPDGKYIAFTENAETFFRSYLMENKPNAPKKLLNDSDEIANSKITWSPDGKTFAVAYMLANQGRIVLYDTQGNEKQTFKQSNGVLLFPQFVDNETLLYVSSSGDTTKVMSLDTSNPSNSREVVTGGNFELSPDKRSLAYLVRKENSDQWKIKVDAIDGNLQIGATLAEVEVKDASSEMAWSPDNQYLLYSDEGSIWALNTKNGTKKQLVSDMWNIIRIIWDEKEGIVFTGIPKEAELKGDYTFSTYRIKLK